jgi:hypothetical protein
VLAGLGTAPTMVGLEQARNYPAGQAGT